MTASTAISETPTYNGLEIPNYAVVLQDGDFEIRDYQGHVVAEVTVSGNRREAANRGFRILANYIFGGNAQGEKIAMTAPVMQSPDESEKQWTIQFMMPSKFSLDSLPDARTDAIRFFQAPSQQQVVYRFSGLAGQSKLDAATKKVKAFATAQGLDVTGEPIYQFYDDPFTNPFKRRNEVAFVLH